jgi:hypothetical protein
LSYGSHIHSASAWKWYKSLNDDEVFFCRFTQLGLLRLLTTAAVTRIDCSTVQEAWRIYDGWLREPLVNFCYEPHDVDALFRLATAPVSRLSSPKALGDCYLLAISQAANATLVTFDAGLSGLGAKLHCDVVLLA